MSSIGPTSSYTRCSMRRQEGRSCHALQNVILSRSGTNLHSREQRRDQSDRCQKFLVNSFAFSLFEGVRRTSPMAEQYTILGGKVHVYKRPNSGCWQCSSYFAGKNRRTSTKEASLSKAKEIAEDWYLQLRGKLRSGEIKTEKTFRKASEQFLREYDILTQGQRSKIYVRGQHSRSTVHLVPFFGPLGLSEITSGKVQEYRIHRLEEATAKRGKPPARNTMHQEIVTLRQTLKAAIRNGWLDRLPDLSEPYRSSPKISHRAWFSPEEYKKLYEATRKRAQEPKAPRFKWESEQLHDFVLFAANTGLRPDEAWRLQFRDVTIVEDGASG